MIGGIITEVIQQPGRIFLNVQDETYPKDRCGIYVEKNADSERIEVGDKVWWQGRTAFWTSPNYYNANDFAIPRVSYSGTEHPEGKDVLDHSTLEVGDAV